MFDFLFDDIGWKLKLLASISFVIEAVSTIIIGLILLLNGGIMILYGLIVLILGPVFSLIPSGVTYAVGEIVEKTAENEKNIKSIIRMMEGKDGISTQPQDKEINEQPKPVFQNTITHKWLCDNCGKMRSNTPCEHCGK